MRTKPVLTVLPVRVGERLALGSWGFLIGVH